MNKVAKIEFKKITRISPSQFYSMKNCAYKSVLAEAFDKKPLLPVSPNAYLGTVLHKVLELMVKGIIKTEEEFNKSFDECIRQEESRLAELGYNFFIPLQKNVKDFGMKKILLKKHMRNKTENHQSAITRKFYSEKWLESKDSLIAGKIDLLVENQDGTEIIDFKTGSITQDFLDDDGEIFIDIKEEYKGQLKLYACLYREATGRFPDKLTLIDLAKQRFEIDFSEVECNSLFEEAKQLLSVTNDGIEHGVFSANPSEANCKYCLYRPACSFFLQFIITDKSFNDVVGTVKNVIKYQNGNVSVFLESEGNTTIITNFSLERYDELNGSLNKYICIFNLRKEATELVYSATKTTVIYE